MPRVGKRWKNDFIKPTHVQCYYITHKTFDLLQKGIVFQLIFLTKHIIQTKVQSLRNENQHISMNKTVTSPEKTTPGNGLQRKENSPNKSHSTCKSSITLG